MMTMMFTRAQHLLYEASGYALHLGEMVYASVNQGSHLLNTSIGFLVMISEIPKPVEWQKYALIRQSRGRWLISLVAFCAMSLGAVSGGDAFRPPLLQRPTPRRAGMERPRAAGRRPGLCVGCSLRRRISARALSPLAACGLAAAVQMGYYLLLTLTVLAFALFDCGNVSIIVCVLMVTAHITLLAELFRASSCRGCMRR